MHYLISLCATQSSYGQSFVICTGAAIFMHSAIKKAGLYARLWFWLCIYIITSRLAKLNDPSLNQGIFLDQTQVF